MHFQKFNAVSDNFYLDSLLFLDVLFGFNLSDNF